MHVLILANGHPPSESLLVQLREEADLFLATDGAANRLPALGLMPDVVLGDFDSLDPSLRSLLPHTEFVHAFDQEASDLDKILAYALERGARHVTLCGAGGGRQDHSLTAISLLVKYARHVDLRLVDEKSVIRVADSQGVSTIELRGRAGDTISLIVFALVEGVTTEGLQWPLTNETLLPGSRGVSNVLAETRGRVSVRSGWLLVCHLFDQKSPEDVIASR